MPRGIALTGRATSKKLQERERKFLVNFYSPDSPTQGNAEASAIEAGYESRSAAVSAHKIVARYKGKAFSVVADLMGMTNAYIAAKFMKIMDNPETYARDVLATGKAVLAMRGEQVEGAKGSQTTVNVQAPKALIITGVDAKKVKAMTQPALPEVSKDEVTTVEVTDGVSTEQPA